MEFFLLLALVLLGLSLLRRRRSYTASAPPDARVVLEKISDPAVAHRALVENADAFSNRPDPSFRAAQARTRGGLRSENLLTARYGPHWRALRCNITAETLHPSRLAHLAPLQREAARALVAGLSAAAAGGEAAVAVRDHLSAAVFAVVVRLCFGDDLDMDERHVRAMRLVVQDLQDAIGELKLETGTATLAGKLGGWRRQRRLFALNGRMWELFLPLFAARRQRPRCAEGGRCLVPYVETLIHLRVPDGSRALRDDEMVSLVSEFLGAGTGTVVASLEWTLAHLVNSQEVQEKLRGEVDGAGEAAAFSCRSSRGMPYLQAVVLESLRMHPTVPFLARHVQAGELVGGTADLLAKFVIGDIGRDSTAWKDPDEFRPERFLAGGEAEGVGPLPGPKEIRMMPFGAGHRFCPGAGLAMANIKCFMAAMVREFEWAPPQPTQGYRGGVDLTELDGFFKTMKKPLSARLTPRRRTAAES